MIRTLTGRSPDQHALDPIPAAAHIPQAAAHLRRIRQNLVLAVDALRTALIHNEDLRAGPFTIDREMARITDHVDRYHAARHELATLIHDPERRQYARQTPARPVKRRYLNPGDLVPLVLPHTDACRKFQIAGHRAYATAVAGSLTVIVTVGSDQVRLSHHDAGVYLDPTTSRLYVLDYADDAAGPRPETG